MCRLYGFRGNAATRLECSLVRSQNALMVQSRADARGESNADGWGIGYYRNDRPVVEKCEVAAFEGEHFLRTAESVSSQTALAHVRRASVGGGGVVNTHPFGLGVWLFAHNGTLTAFDHLAPVLESETDSDFLATRRGTTDSELIFVWLMSRMVRSGIDSKVVCPDPRRLTSVLTEAVGELAARNSATRPESPAKLNFLLTDGVTLAASRWGNTLFSLMRDEPSECGVCGSLHGEMPRAGSYKAGAIASEPITAEGWEEVPDRSLVIIGPDIDRHTGPLSE